MIEITQQEFEDNFDSYMDRVEKNQELFLIRLPDGKGVVMTPVADEMKDLFDDVVNKNYAPEITDWIMIETKMRIVEKLKTGDEVITYFSVKMIDKKFYYVYNDVNHGPYEDFDDAVEAAHEDLIPHPDMESL